MKLSEAIRLGSLLKPQGFGALERDGKTCAFGAAVEAAGLESMEGVCRVWRFIYQNRAQCPDCPNIGMNPVRDVSDVIVHLNDLHFWPRERIADWVATIEPEESPSVVMEETMEALQV